MRTTRNFTAAFLACALLAAVTASGSQEIPDTITLSSLGNLYQPVRFNHAGHIVALKDCGTCHHHTVGTPSSDRNCGRCHKSIEAQRVFDCKKCHAATPFTAANVNARMADPQRYHRDTPGLKAAYHLSCSGCHEEMSGPTGCTDCHALTDQGKAVYRTGAYTPEAGHGKKGH